MKVIDSFKVYDFYEENNFKILLEYQIFLVQNSYLIVVFNKVLSKYQLCFNSECKTGSTTYMSEFKNDYDWTILR